MSETITMEQAKTLAENCFVIGVVFGVLFTLALQYILTRTNAPQTKEDVK